MESKRGLSGEFLNGLRDGLLYPILERVRKDHTLMLAIREDYINIYYRGGNILRIKDLGNCSYSAYFDENYGKLHENHEHRISNLPKTIKDKSDADAWVNALPHLKEIMDLYFSEKSKPEREFQQLVVRENNYSTISGETEYFISDIEVADPDLRARFDMLAVRWLASKRKNGSNCQAALFEMKYGDDALGGSAGLLKHLQDIEDFLSDKNKYSNLLYSMEVQFSQLDELGLLKFNKSKNGTKIQLDHASKPEVIFLLANHNPRSTALRKMLNDLKNGKYEKSDHFELKFFVSSFAGYGLHSDNMVDLIEFRELIKKYEKKL